MRAPTPVLLVPSCLIRCREVRRSQEPPLFAISARPSSFCAARLQSVRLRASRRLQGLHQHRSWAHPICPMHECHAQHHRRHPDPLCDHLRLLSGCEMTGGIIPCSDDAPVRSPCCASTFRPAIFRVSSRGACAQSCARLPICCSVAPPLTAR